MSGVEVACTQGNFCHLQLHLSLLLLSLRYISGNSAPPLQSPGSRHVFTLFALVLLSSQASPSSSGRLGRSLNLRHHHSLKSSQARPHPPSSIYLRRHRSPVLLLEADFLPLCLLRVKLLNL